MLEERILKTPSTQLRLGLLLVTDDKMKKNIVLCDL
jgi:hypothetical protein